MRPEIIITLRDAGGNFNYDLEVPTDIPAGMLTENIKEVLAAYDPGLSRVKELSTLYSERLGTEIPAKRTLGSTGIWNGDILIIK